MALFCVESQQIRCHTANVGSGAFWRRGRQGRAANGSPRGEDLLADERGWGELAWPGDTANDGQICAAAKSQQSVTLCARSEIRGGLRAIGLAKRQRLLQG